MLPVGGEHQTGIGHQSALSLRCGLKRAVFQSQKIGIPAAGVPGAGAVRNGGENRGFRRRRFQEICRVRRVEEQQPFRAVEFRLWRFDCQQPVISGELQTGEAAPLQQFGIDQFAVEHIEIEQAGRVRTCRSADRFRDDQHAFIRRQRRRRESGSAGDSRGRGGGAPAEDFVVFRQPGGEHAGRSAGAVVGPRSVDGEQTAGLLNPGLFPPRVDVENRRQFRRGTDGGKGEKREQAAGEPRHGNLRG